MAKVVWVLVWVSCLNIQAVECLNRANKTNHQKTVLAVVPVWGE